MGVLLTLLLALSVKTDQAPLRSGCAADARVVANLPAGTALTLRYVMAGEAVPCYKVAADVDGKHWEGYLPIAAMEGLDSIDKSRREAEKSISAAGLPTASNLAALTASAKAAVSGRTQANLLRLIAQASDAIEAGEPAKALELLEPQLKTQRDPGLLQMAGLAAWKADQTKQALEYWREALDLSPNPGLEGLYQRVLREQKNDQSGEKLFGIRVVLRYDPKTVPVETARQMTAAVDRTYARVSQQLGCTTQERIVTIVQSTEDYRKATGAAEWSGGQFDGRIRVTAASGQDMTAEAQRKLAHETAHACLAMLGDWPSWLHEGMAQKLSGDTLRPSTRAQLTQLAKDGQLPKLEKVANGWGGLDNAHAEVAYALALAAAEAMFETYGNDGVRMLLHNPERLAVISAELDKKLGL